ncbi:MAG: AbrB/MazE/SpoVT family DNA-binding domain-containing protein [Nitrospirae bacterium]|nr:AbrB/MazE/SpoVT family DNA-binding domain-containing protein [Nitrospirota bacterium]
MPIVKVKDKFQVTVPADIRAKLSLKVGDLLEATVKNGHLELSPKTLVDREIALAEADIKAGRYLGPFETVEEGARALERFAKSRKVGRRAARRRTA